MSQESVAALIVKLKEDPEFRQTLNQQMKQANGDLVRAAKAVGYDFTAEEFEALATQQGAALSDTELEGILGGFGPEGSDIGSGPSFTSRSGSSERKRASTSFDSGKLSSGD
jgi:predicted ribosomally synthesized peptide with nif11-like leader